MIDRIGGNGIAAGKIVGFSRGVMRFGDEVSQACSRINRAEVVASAEVRRTSAEQGIGCERIVSATGSELDIIDRTAANTPGGFRVEVDWLAVSCP